MRIRLGCVVRVRVTFGCAFTRPQLLLDFALHTQIAHVYTEQAFKHINMTLSAAALRLACCSIIARKLTALKL